MSGARWMIAVLGLWLILAAFLGLGSQANLWNDLLVGVVVAGAAFSLGTESAREGWTAGLLGAWLIVAAFMPGLREGLGVMWNDLLVGLGVALAGAMPARTTQVSHVHDHV